MTVPASIADRLCADLRPITGVIGLAHHPGASIVPPGDEIVVHALNRATDEVMQAATVACGETGFTVVTAEVASISNAKRQEEIDSDVDEAIWEELETGLRHQGRVSQNFILLMALGGIIAAAATVAAPTVGIIAFVASAIIAPGFEPIAKLPLGLVLRRWSVLKAGLTSAVIGYGVLIGAAAMTWWGLASAGVEPAKFLAGEPLHETLHPPVELLAISLAGAFAGIIIVASYRRSVIAGALVAMRLIEAAAVVGVALAMGEWRIVGGGLARLGLDLAFVIVAGLLVFGLKQAFVHRRSPIR